VYPPGSLVLCIRQDRKIPCAREERLRQIHPGHQEEEEMVVEPERCINGRLLAH